MQFNEEYFQRLSRSDGVVRVVNAAANRVLDAAVASAPVDTGAYKAGLVLEEKNQQRHVAVVKGRDPKTMLVEAHTGNLARALRTAKRR